MKTLSRIAWFALLTMTPAVLPGQSYSITTIAGLTTAREGGRAVDTALRLPYGLAVDTPGNIYIADSDAHRVRRVAPDGTITTIAGRGLAGFAGDGGNAADATLRFPQGLALDSQGNLYIADTGNSRVRRINLANGVITTVAGNGNFRFGGDGAPALQAGMDPNDVAIGRDGNLYIADTFNDRVRRVDLATGLITTFAGTGVSGDSGDNGPATQATLFDPLSLSFDGSGNLYIADSSNDRVRRVSPDGRITAFAGSSAAGASGAENIPALNAFFPGVGSVSADSRGNVLIVAGVGVRLVNPQGLINTVAGSLQAIGFSNDGAPALGSPLAEVNTALLLPNGEILLTEIGRVRRVRQGVLETVAGVAVRDGTPALGSSFNFPTGVAADAAGNILISDSFNNRVRRLDGNGNVSTLAGTGLRRGSGVIVNNPTGMFVDRDGSVLVAGTGFNRVLRITPTGATQTVAGTGRRGFSGDSSIATSADLSNPGDVVVDANQNIYIADFGNRRVRRINADGIISTVAGNGQSGFGGDGGPATQARVNPAGIALDATGGLLIADAINHRIRRVDLRLGTINTVAGVGSAGFSGDGGPAVQAQLFAPANLAVDAAGNIFVTDYGNSRIRRIGANGVITTIAGNGGFISSAETGAATAVSFDPAYVSFDRAGNLLVADAFNDRIRRLTPISARALAISSGNNQTGPAGGRLTLAVRVTGDGDLPIANAAVSFTAGAGAGTLNPATASTGGDGIARTEITLGANAGPVTVTATSPGLSPVTFNLTITAVVPTRPTPRITAGGVVGAGLSVPPVRTLSAGTIASIFGENFAPAGTLRRVGNEDLVNGQVPQNFAGVCVTVGGVRAPIYFVTPGQINFQAPVAAAGRTEVRVLAGCGLADEAASAAVTVDYAAQSPEFFYFLTRADGANPVAATDAVTGALIGAPGLIPGANFTPARPDQLVTIYLTGLGDTDPPVLPGEIPQSIARIRASLRITLGGTEIPANRILYAGIAPFNPGLYQINFYIPADAAAGDLPLVVTAASAVTPPGGFLTVAR